MVLILVQVNKTCFSFFFLTNYSSFFKMFIVKDFPCHFVFALAFSSTYFTMFPLLKKKKDFYCGLLFPQERNCSEVACSICIATEGLCHMKIFCLKLERLHNIVLNTACSEQLMEGRHRESDDITTREEKKQAKQAHLSS